MSGVATSSRCDDSNAEDYTGPTIGHINNEVRTSYEQEVKAVLRHLLVFIDKYHSIPEFNHLGLSPSMDTSDLSFEVINDEEFVGRWTTFLADEAKSLDGSNNLLSLSLASRYASTFASYYINHHRNESEMPRPLKKTLWCKQMSKITEKKYSMKRNAVQEMSEHLSPHVFAERRGWSVRNLRSRVDYMVTSSRQDADAGNIN